ncbi:helix-turn-helix domain-containing protein [Pelosinus fermentans]|uniref:helix-turn-helix domain-containing protein n=1 Tax=Pelosinus fermentans TaxID=365349 RepID=UPI0002F75C09|nr:helix-turn-helix transcriptional regulator [Pelosinus fermentans]
MKNKRLIQRREDLKLTQRQVSEVIHISQSMLSRAESGDRALDDANKIKLAKLYKVTVEWLFFEEFYD